jgi:thioester reductase-like protein
MPVIDDLDLINFCILNKMESYKIPNYFMYLNEFPKNATGKIMRNKLKELFNISVENNIQNNNHTNNNNQLININEFINLLSKITNLNINNMLLYNLPSLGIDSSGLIRIIQQCKIKLNINITIDIIYRCTIQEIINYISSTEYGTSTNNIHSNTNIVDWYSESTLPDNIKNNFILQKQNTISMNITNNSSSNNANKHILLTGCTGFLGLYLLRDLLLSCSVSYVYVIIRGENIEQKLYNNAIKYNIYNYIIPYKHKIIFLPGDLSLIKLGLHINDYNNLITCITDIIHNGALVNWKYSYPLLKEVNVISTIQLLELASLCSTPVRFNYVSSIGVFHNSEEERHDEFMELSIENDAMNNMQGYGASKRISEILIRQAVMNGLNATIFRPGTISGSRINGCCNESDTINRFIKTICELRVAPGIHDNYNKITIAPVEFVSHIICNHIFMITDSSSSSGSNHNNNYQIIGDGKIQYCNIVGENYFTINELITICEQYLNCFINRVQLHEFNNMVIHNNNSLSLISEYFINEMTLPISNETEKIYHKNMNLYITDKTLSIIDKDLLMKYVAFLYKK